MFATAQQNALTVAGRLGASGQSIGAGPDLRQGPPPPGQKEWDYLAKKAAGLFFLGFSSVALINSIEVAVFAESAFAVVAPWLFIAAGAGSVLWGFFNWVSD